MDETKVVEDFLSKVVQTFSSALWKFRKGYMAEKISQEFSSLLL